jgi:hypothetical protein
MHRSPKRVTGDTSSPTLIDPSDSSMAIGKGNITASEGASQETSVASSPSQKSPMGREDGIESPISVEEIPAPILGVESAQIVDTPPALQPMIAPSGSPDIKSLPKQKSPKETDLPGESETEQVHTSVMPELSISDPEEGGTPSVARL